MLPSPIHTRWAQAAPRIDAAVAAARGPVLGAVLAAWAIGYAAWAVSHVGLLQGALANTLSHAERMSALQLIGGVGTVVLALIGGWAAWRRVRPTAPSPAPLLPLVLAAPFAATLLTPAIERDHPAATLVLAIVAGLGCTLSVASFPWSPPATRDGRASRILAPLLVALLWVGYSIYFSVLSIRFVDALGTRIYDLSIYNNILYHTAHGDFLGTSLVRGGTHATAHFDPILIALSLPYRLFPDVTTLLVLQSIWCGFGVIPAWLLGRRHLGSTWAGLAVAVVYALHPALQGANTNAFHSLALVASPVLLAWYFLDVGHYKRYLLLLPILWTIREDVSLLCMFIGASLMLARGDSKRVGVGLLTIVGSAIWFLVVKRWFMASPEIFMKGEDTYDYSDAYTFMIPNERGMRDYLLTCLTNPVAVLRFAFDAEKLTYLLKMLGPLLFLPIFAPRGRFALGYAFLFLMLASKESMYGTIGQYSLVALPILIGLLPAGLDAVSRLPVFHPGRGKWALLAGILVSSALISTKFGAMAPNTTLAKVTAPFTPEQRERREFIETLIRTIPADASVLASNKLLPFVSNRTYAYVLESSYLQPERPADYCLLTTAGMDQADAKSYKRRFKDVELYDVVDSKFGVTLYQLKRGADRSP